MSVNTEDYGHSGTEDLVLDGEGGLKPLSEVEEELDGPIDSIQYEDLVSTYGETALETSSIEEESYLDGVEDGAGCAEIWEHMSEQPDN